MMKTAIPALFLAMLFGTSPALAQDKKTAPATNDRAGGKVQDGPTHRVSAGIAATIQASLPKYQPPPPPPPPEEEKPAPTKASVVGNEEMAEEVASDGQTDDTDQPKNKIIRLPRYVVEAARPPIFKESEVYTKSGLAKLAMKRYLSDFDKNFLNKYTIPLFGISPEQRALMQYQEDERLKNMEDLTTAARAARISGDKAGSEAIKDERDSALMRSGGMDWGLPKN